MAQEALKDFAAALRRDPQLAAAFAATVADFARKAGHDVAAADVTAALRPAPSRGQTHMDDRARDWDEIYAGPRP